MAPVTDIAIVAHGQPGDPGPLQRYVADLAARVDALLPDLCVRGATLACTDSLSQIVTTRLIYPLFMADGWFTQTEMPRRLHAAGVHPAMVADPLGLDPDLPAIGLKVALDAAAMAGLTPADTTLIVAGHGSGRGEAAANACRRFADAIARQGRFARVVTGFIEQQPWLADVARLPGPCLCLPFFATAAVHVTHDIPAAMDKAGMTGPVTPPLGLDPDIAALIARRLSAIWDAAMERDMKRDVI